MTGNRDLFDKRLREAESRQKSASPEPLADSEDKSLVAVAARAGTEMIGSMLVGVIVGWGLDHWLHFRFLFLVVFALLGGCAGVLNVWRLVKPPELDGKS